MVKVTSTGCLSTRIFSLVFHLITSSGWKKEAEVGRSLLEKWNETIGFPVFLGPPKKQQSKIMPRTHYQIGKWHVFKPYFLWLEIWIHGSCLKIWDRPRKWVLTRTTLFFWIPSLPEVLIQLGDSECFCRVSSSQLTCVIYFKRMLFFSLFCRFRGRTYLIYISIWLYNFSR